MCVKRNNKHHLPGLAKVLACSDGITAEPAPAALALSVLRISMGCTGVLSVHDLIYLLVSSLQPLTHQRLYCSRFFPPLKINWSIAFLQRRKLKSSLPKLSNPTIINQSACTLHLKQIEP